MENKATSSPGRVFVPPEENPRQMSKRPITERPCYRIGVLRSEGDMMKKHTPIHSVIYICNTCERRFSSNHAMLVHQKTHKRDQQLEHQKVIESGRSLLRSLVKSQESESGISLGPINPMERGRNNVEMKMAQQATLYTSLIGNNGCGSALPCNYSMNVNHLGRSMSVGGSSSSNAYPWINGEVSRGITDMQTTMSPPLTGNISYGDHLEFSLGPSKSTGRGGNSYSPHTVAQDDPLELSLAPPNSIGGNNYPWLNGGVTNQNMRVCPPVSLCRFFPEKPLDSVIKTVLSNHFSSFPKNVSGSTNSDNIGKTVILLDCDDTDDDDDRHRNENTEVIEIPDED